MKRIGVFARWPVEDRVKTRLSPALPASLACRLHVALVADTLGAVAVAIADERVVFWADATDAPNRITVPAGVGGRDQLDGDLGHRLAGAFGWMLRASGDRAVIVGSDCPALTPAHLDGAFSALERADLVLGPCPDGGYWLIGLTGPVPALFEGVNWGSERVIAETLERAGRAGLRVAELETLSDLDTPEDLARFVATGLLFPGTVPAATGAALREMRLLP